MAVYQGSKLFFTIKNQINKMDIYSLIGGGCPNDEFDKESKMIYQKINKGMGVNQIANIIRDVFCRMFDDDFRLELFIESAKVIEKEMNK